MADRTRVQIYTMQSVEEALAVAALGVDHVGVTPARLGLPGEIDVDTAAEICEAVRREATSVALSVEDDPASIAAMVRGCRPDVLHLCGPPGRFGPNAVAALRLMIPDVEIMQAIAVTGPEAIEVAREYAFVADFLILDSHDASILGVGAVGRVHDWSISAAIVRAVDVPVILAGGLTPENVGAAIAEVRPWGVDSLTHTNRLLAGGGFEKDLELVSGFIAAVRKAAM